MRAPACKLMGIEETLRAVQASLRAQDIDCRHDLPSSINSETGQFRE
jgi:hypothetical protein